MPFLLINYKLMAMGVLIIAIGLYIMTLDTNTFGFGALGLTIGPMILLAGFLFEFVAILYTPQNKRDNKTQ